MVGGAVGYCRMVGGDLGVFPIGWRGREDFLIVEGGRRGSEMEFKNY